MYQPVGIIMGKGEKMKNKILIVVCCIFLFLVAACNRVPRLANGEEVVASLNGRDFTADDLYRELLNTHAYQALMAMIDRFIASEEVERTAAMEAQVRGVVEFHRAQAQGSNLTLLEYLRFFQIHLDNEEEFFEFLMNEHLMDLAVVGQVRRTIPNNDVERFHNENFSERLTVRHILIELDEADTDGSRARAQANTLLAQLNAVSSDELVETFIELAREYSDCASFANGGLLSDFMAATVVEPFWEASIALRDGQLRPTLLRTEFGYHIIYRVSIAPKPSLESVRDEILETMAQQLLREDETLFFTAIVGLRERHNLNIIDPTLRSINNHFLDSLR